MEGRTDTVRRKMARSRRRGMTTAEDELANFVEKLDDDKLECKIARRHRLPKVTDPRKTRFTKRKDGVFVQVSRCEWCGTEVRKLVAPSGYLDEVAGQQRYDWPEGYLNPPSTRGVGAREANAILRREGRRRNVERAKVLDRHGD